MSNEIRVVVADDHPIVRQGLRQTIESDADLRVVAEAGDGRAALAAIAAHDPRVAVLDVDMPEMDGFAAARAARAANPQTEIVFLTIHRDEDVFNEAVEIGAKGYVLKDSALGDIVACIKAVAAGRHFISPSLTEYLVKRAQRRGAADEKSILSRLTPAECRVLRLIAEYKTSREIAEELFVSVRTVETHRTNISQKLDLRGSHALAKFAVAHKTELE